MEIGPDIAATVATAIKAIKLAADLVGETESGIDDTQIKDLRKAIDDLELKLNEKKRTLNANRT